MFGSILGTLQKFRADETKVKDRELKKRQIEAKIDKKTEKEREEAIRQKKELFEDKRRKEREIKVLQVKFEVPSVLHLYGVNFFNWVIQLVKQGCTHNIIVCRYK